MATRKVSSTSGYVIWPSGDYAQTIAKARKLADDLQRQFPSDRVYVEHIRSEKVKYRPRSQNPARLPIGKKIKVNYIVVKRDGTIQASVPVRRAANPRKRKMNYTVSTKGGKWYVTVHGGGYIEKFGPYANQSTAMRAGERKS